MVALDFACRHFYGKSYPELLNFLVYMGKLLINIYELDENKKTQEGEGEKSEPQAAQAKIGFKIE